MASDEDGRTGVSTNRRTLLKGATATGMFGIGVAGTASADEKDGDEKDGEDGEKDADGDRKHLRFEAAGEDVFSYRVSVSGKLEREANRDGYDTQVDANTAEGSASKGRYDDWLFTGKITSLKLDGPGRVLVNGEAVRDTTKAVRDRGDDDRLPKVVVVSSPGTDQLQNYAFRVTGDLVNLEPEEDTGNAVDEVIDLGDEGTGVEGAVSTGDDRFAFSGDLVREEIPPGVRLEVGRR